MNRALSIYPSSSCGMERRTTSCSQAPLSHTFGLFFSPSLSCLQSDTTTAQPVQLSRVVDHSEKQWVKHKLQVFFWLVTAEYYWSLIGHHIHLSPERQTPKKLQVPTHFVEIFFSPFYYCGAWPFPSSPANPSNPIHGLFTVFMCGLQSVVWGPLEVTSEVYGGHISIICVLSRLKKPSLKRVHAITIFF